MNSKIQHPVVNETSLWIENLINGLSGMTIKARHSLYCGSSPFQKIEVYDTYSFGLVLCLGGTVVLTERDSEPYHEMMVHPAMLMHKDPKRICIIGGGDGGCLNEVLRHPGVENVVVVEIDEMVRETVQNFFPQFGKGFADPRAEMIVDDGYHFLSATDLGFDLIVVDSYDPGGPVHSLETNDFYSVVAKRLRPDGIAVFQTGPPLVNEEFLRDMTLSVSALYAQYKPFICSMRSFPEGMCSFIAASLSENGLEAFSESGYKRIKDECRYYNDEVHKGAFMLPQNIKSIFRS
ncbi:Spermidine synthase [Chitinispirillum alkaliphilum]|nr:Spermidine synthase [Chitinispirillum alkaliphilum]